MAVEIKEIVIRAVLTGDATPDQGSSHDAQDKEAMIQECVAQVLKVLQKKNHR